METGEKSCPFCAETIKAEARVCRFCNRVLETGAQAPAIQQVEAKSGVMSGVKIGFGIFVILPIFIIGGIVAFVVFVGSCAKLVTLKQTVDKRPAVHSPRK